MKHVRQVTKARPAAAQDTALAKQFFEWFNFAVDVLIVLTRLAGPKIL